MAAPRHRGRGSPRALAAEGALADAARPPHGPQARPCVDPVLVPTGSPGSSPHGARARPHTDPVLIPTGILGTSPQGPWARPHTGPGLVPTQTPGSSPHGPWAPQLPRLPKRGEAGSRIQSYPVSSSHLDLSFYSVQSLYPSTPFLSSSALPLPHSHLKPTSTVSAFNTQFRKRISLITSVFAKIR